MQKIRSGIAIPAGPAGEPHPCARPQGLSIGNAQMPMLMACLSSELYPLAVEIHLDSGCLIIQLSVLKQKENTVGFL